MTTEPVVDRIQLARGESRRLGEYFNGLPPDALSMQSACDLWTVGDVVAHLAFTARFQGGMIGRGLAGDATPPEGARRAAAEPNAPPASERIAQGAISAREKLGDQLIPTFHTHYEELFQLLDGIKADDFGKPCWHPRGPTSVAEFVDMVVMELTVHGWDIRSRLEPDYRLTPEILPSVLNMAPGWQRNLFRPSAPLAAPIRYRFEVADAPVPNDVIVEGDAFRVEAQGTHSVHVTFRCDPTTYTLLVYGRLSVEQALSEGSLTHDGDQAKALQYGQGFSGTGT